MMNKIIASNDHLIIELVKSNLFLIYKNGRIKKKFKKNGTNFFKIYDVYQSFTSSGYKVITYKGVKLSIHRIIFYKFHKYLDGTKVVNHINHNRADNRLTNLELINHSENSRRVFDRGLHKSSKLNIKIVGKIRQDFTGGMSYKLISKKYKISLFIVRRIIKYETWTDHIIQKHKYKNRDHMISLLIKDGNYTILKNGNIYSKHKGIVKKIKPIIAHKYSFIKYKGCQIAIHRIVFSKFMGKIKVGFVINHKDGNSFNNSLKNLEMVTQSNNMKHSSRVLNKKMKSMFNEKELKKIKKLRKCNVTYQKIANQFECGKTTIRNICSKN